MDDKTKTDIEAGVPMVIAHWDKEGNVTSQETYNLENISLSDWQKEQLARATLEACRKFYSDRKMSKNTKHGKPKEMRQKGVNKI